MYIHMYYTLYTIYNILLKYKIPYILYTVYEFIL